MKTVRLGLLVAFLGWWIALANARPEVPAAAREVLTQFEAEGGELDKQIEAEILKCREHGIAELRKAQDDLTRQGKLDEAIAVRELIQLVQRGAPVALHPTIPAGVRKAYRDYEEDVAVLYEKANAEYGKRREKAIGELKKIQDAFSKEAKLDEAIAVRAQIQALTQDKVAVLPDPGFINNQPVDIGKTFCYEVTGTGPATGGVVYGTDVYVIGSHLGTAAVHSGLLKEGEKGVLKVTIVPGQNAYPASTRNGVTSQPFGRAEAGFTMTRVYRLRYKPFVAAPLAERPLPPPSNKKE